MRASFKRPRVEFSSGAPPPPSSGDSTTDEFVDLTSIATPSPSTSNDSSICRVLDTVMTV